MTPEHTVEETLTEILRRLDSIAESMLVVRNYFSEKGHRPSDGMKCIACASPNTFYSVHDRQVKPNHMRYICFDCGETWTRRTR